MMDYEKKYNEALEMARKIRNGNPSSGTAIVVCEQIFPELAESEDEKIRRTLVEYFSPEVQLDFVRGVPIQKIRDWLEKQKEEEGYEAIPVESTLEYKLGFKAGKEYEKQKEQKPAWSEEDEDKLNQCIRIVTGWEADYDIVHSPYSNFLKSLRPQPKQEWSEKDKKILQSLHHVMNCADAQNAVKRDGLSVEDVCTFLFSVQPSWKPSDERIAVLWDAISNLKHDGYKEIDTLISLYENLKKL